MQQEGGHQHHTTQWGQTKGKTKCTIYYKS